MIQTIITQSNIAKKTAIKLDVVVVLLGLMLTSVSTFAEQANASKSEREMVQSTTSVIPKSKTRDPHAYSSGYTLTKGPYAQAGKRQLVLADEHKFYAVLGDRLEYNTQSNSGVFDIQTWYGTTFDRFVVKSEGEFADGLIEESQTDFLWGHAFTPFWDTQIGIRLDYNSEGDNRQWLAFGLQGLAPYWFEMDMTGYLGEDGNTAFSIEAEFELLLTQKLVLQPRFEIAFYGNNDEQNRIGSGLSTSAIGARLRYEFSRQFAPYIGVEWTNRYGQTAEYAELDGNKSNQTEYVAGIKFWF
ncbi:copper resistance protein B [Psychrosphaera sp. 1_MG-2023]|uniref:copper resistance protein B n=1 Tax=Psychrosphaera sp. 1_MG-2023 TaxID=3062643 RepID=UPI0026E46A5B|nr:copper resistance protein B [Psychrosphaera sp. 1_MG-2023]MDO6719175.1 copper resistance protein B [Psychrosphaera sp. 1_MG-2023]